MPHYLPSGRDTKEIPANVSVGVASASSDPMADLKIFWGPEICRLEYLVHLLDTGRIKDEYERQSA